MEYMPFGELLADEHLNSYNSPFKFNAKELDDETGNYYYGARYYNPKTSIWLSVDPMADKYPDNYCMQNSVKMADPTMNEMRVYSKLNSRGETVWGYTFEHHAKGKIHLFPGYSW